MSTSSPKRLKYTRPPIPNDAHKTTLVLDQIPASDPVNYRIARLYDFGADAHALNSSDLAGLHLSGSAEFTPASFSKIVADAQRPVVVFDLRQESHAFIDGHAVTWQALHDWSNIGKTSEAVILDERKKLEALKSREVVPVYTGDCAPHPQVPVLPCRDLMTELDLVENGSHGARYLRLTVTDHARPSDAMIDHFLLLLRAIAHKHHCHFHCRAGIVVFSFAS